MVSNPSPFKGRQPERPSLRENHSYQSYQPFSGVSQTKTANVARDENTMEIYVQKKCETLLVYARTAEFDFDSRHDKKISKKKITFERTHEKSFFVKYNIIFYVTCVFSI